VAKIRPDLRAVIARTEIERLLFTIVSGDMEVKQADIDRWMDDVRADKQRAYGAYLIPNAGERIEEAAKPSVLMAVKEKVEDANRLFFPGTMHCRRNC
jgi:hypothetical protein